MGPFIKSKNNTDKMMKNLIIALIPIVLFSEYKNGVIPYINDKTDLLGLYYPLIFILVAMISTFVFESLYCKIAKIKSHYSVITGLFIALVLPLNTPISILILGCFIGIVLGKMLYGGFGNNIFNPALIGCVFILTAYSSIIISNGGYLNSYEVDTISSATPLSNEVEGIGTYDSLVKPYGEISNFFIGTIPGSVGETSALLCFLGFIFLCIKKVIKAKIPIIYISTVFVITYIIGSMNNLGIWYPLFQIFSGGLMFGAIFMATDPVTSPTTSLGQVIYALCLAVLTVIFRYLTIYPEGVLSSILMMNMFVFILDKIGLRTKNYVKKIVISLSIIIVLTVPIIYRINNSFNDKVDTDFKIIEKTNNNGITKYIVSQKGFKGIIKVSIEIENKKVISYKILECSDDYLSLVEKSNFINDLVSKNDKVDTVSGATKTSTTLKKILINVMKEEDIYEGKN